SFIFAFAVFLTLSLSAFFLIDPPPPQLSTLSLHDALPISGGRVLARHRPDAGGRSVLRPRARVSHGGVLSRLGPVVAELTVRLRSEEHTSELQSPDHLVCRLLLEKKKIKDEMKYKI